MIRLNIKNVSLAILGILMGLNISIQFVQNTKATEDESSVLVQQGENPRANEGFKVRKGQGQLPAYDASEPGKSFVPGNSTKQLSTNLVSILPKTDSNETALIKWQNMLKSTNEIAFMVKEQLNNELGLDRQTDLLIQLAKEVKELKDEKNEIAARIRTEVPETTRKIPKCTHNPEMFFENTGIMINECVTKAETTDTRKNRGWPTRAFILTLKPKQHPQISSRLQFLRSHGISAEVFKAINGPMRFAQNYSTRIDSKGVPYLVLHTDSNQTLFKEDKGYLTPGERGYRETMRKLFYELMQGGVRSHVLVLDDDAMFDCHFKESLTALLKDTRCGNTVYSPKSAGALLLGAAIWIQGTFPETGPYTAGWRLTDTMIRRMYASTGTPPQCINAHSKVFGSFAVIYHSSIFPLVLEWLDTVQLPFDHIYPFLVRKNKIVRVAYPNLAIQELRHLSQIDPTRIDQHNMTVRAKIHRWLPVERYCDPMSGKPVQL